MLLYNYSKGKGKQSWKENKTMMNELKFSTKAGKKVYEMGNRCEDIH